MIAWFYRNIWGAAWLCLSCSRSERRRVHEGLPFQWHCWLKHREEQ